MNGDETKYFEEKFKRLDDRWIQHDDRSKDLKSHLDQRFFHLQDNVDRMAVKIGDIPCKAHSAKIEGLQDRFKLIWGVIIVVITGICGGFWWVVITG